MSRDDYAEPVAGLMKLGKPEAWRAEDWIDYRELGLERRHVPELIRLATDKEVNLSDPDDPAVWGPMHAWRALGQLRAVEAIDPLMQFMTEMLDDDWMREDLPLAMRLIGGEAVPALARWLADERQDVYVRWVAASGLEEIGGWDAESRPLCIDILMQHLKNYRRNPRILNAFLISSLTDLYVPDSLELIEEAYRARCVDLSLIRFHEVQSVYLEGGDI